MIRVFTYPEDASRPKRTPLEHYPAPDRYDPPVGWAT